MKVCLSRFLAEGKGRLGKADSIPMLKEGGNNRYLAITRLTSAEVVEAHERLEEVDDCAARSDRDDFVGGVVDRSHNFDGLDWYEV